MAKNLGPVPAGAGSSMVDETGVIIGTSTTPSSTVPRNSSGTEIGTAAAPAAVTLYDGASAAFATASNPATVQNHLISVSRGLISDQSCINKFGRNAAVTTSEETVWSAGGLYTGWLTAAIAVRIKAGGDAADDTAGAGAQQVTIIGLDENWAAASETIATAGVGVSSATTTTFLRVYRAHVANVGTYGAANTAAINIETTAGVVVAQIGIEKGQTQLALYTIPAAKTGYIYEVSASIDGNKQLDVEFWQRPNADDVTTPFTSKRLWHAFAGLTGSTSRTFTAPRAFAAKTDIWASATALSGTGGVSARFDVLLIDD